PCMNRKERKRPSVQPSVILRLRTMPPTLSETDASEWLSSITGPTWILSGSSTGNAMLVVPSLVAVRIRKSCFPHQVAPRIGERGIRIADVGEECASRARVQFPKQREVRRLALPLRNLAVRIVQIAEHDRVRRAGSLAGRDNFTVLHFAVFLLRHDLCVVDALHAVRALFHDAAAANRDIGIALQLDAFGFPIGIEQEVKAANL